MADDGHGTFNPRITAFRHAISQNAALGLEAAEALQEFGYAFGAEMNRVGTSVDMTLPEARKFRESWEDLRDEFQAFMSLVPLSNATQLVELAGQAKILQRNLTPCRRCAGGRRQNRVNTSRRTRALRRESLLERK